MNNEGHVVTIKTLAVVTNQLFKNHPHYPKASNCTAAKTEFKYKRAKRERERDKILKINIVINIWISIPIHYYSNFETFMPRQSDESVVKEYYVVRRRKHLALQ